MSKNSLYLIVAIALGATAGSFFITRNSSQACTVMRAIPAASSPIEEQAHAAARGYPFWYYQEPLPLSCMSGNNVAVGGTFNTASLAYDFLIWLMAALLLCLPSALFRWWRGPRMLGDNVRHA